LNENLQLLNEETTVTGAEYLLKLKTPSPGGDSPGTARITKGSKITKNGDFINVDSKDVSYNYNCTNSTFQAISKSGIPMIKTMWNNAIYTSDSKDLTAILDTKFCKTTSTQSEKKTTTEGTTSKEYTLQMRINNSLSMARQTFKIPKGLPITKRGNVIEIGSAKSPDFYGYGCDTKNFGYMGSFSGSQGAAYENNELAKLLDAEYCKSTSKTSSFDWMARNDNNYWTVLKRNLENNDLVPYVKESSDNNQGTFYYWGKFIVWRNTPNKFITHADTNITGKISNYNGKYAGQNALSNIELTLSNGEKSNVLDFITKYSSTISGRDSGVRNDPGKDRKPKPDYTPGGGGKNECKGTYSMGCITPEVGEAQQCLKDDGLYPYRVDNKFGSKTRDAVKAKIGKTYFTDADLQTICKTKKGGGGDDEYDFDKDMGGGSGQQEKEDTTWTGDVY